jgi:hypothetical protein
LDQDLLRKTNDLLEGIQQLPERERERFLRSQTLHDPELYAEVKRRLLHIPQLDETAPSASGSSAGHLPETEQAVHTGTEPEDASAPQDLPPLSIPHLQVETLLAQGGMGAVYLASQVKRASTAGWR